MAANSQPTRLHRPRGAMISAGTGGCPVSAVGPSGPGAVPAALAPVALIPAALAGPGVTGPGRSLCRAGAPVTRLTGPARATRWPSVWLSGPAGTGGPAYPESAG